MRAVIQRVTKASVAVDGEIAGAIERGLLVLLGIESADGASDLDYIFRKTVGLRVFEDTQGKMNVSLKDTGGQLLVVSQFTLLGDVRHGNRPSFLQAAPPQLAKAMYLDFVARCQEDGILVATGVFQADMQVTLTNDGPVTILIDSRKQF